MLVLLGYLHVFIFDNISFDIEDIQIFLLNMSFISRAKWTIFIFHE